MTHPKDIPTSKELQDFTLNLEGVKHLQPLPWLNTGKAEEELRALTKKLAASRCRLPDEITMDDLIAEDWNPVMDQTPQWCPEEIAKLSPAEAFKAGEKLGDYVIAKKKLEEGKISPNEFRKMAERLTTHTPLKPTTGGCSTEDTTTKEDDASDFQELDRVAYKSHKGAEWEEGTVKEIRGEILMVVWDADVKRGVRSGFTPESTMAKSIRKWQVKHSHEMYDEPELDEEQFDPDLKMDW